MLLEPGKLTQLPRGFLRGDIGSGSGMMARWEIRDVGKGEKAFREPRLQQRLKLIAVTLPTFQVLFQGRGVFVDERSFNLLQLSFKAGDGAGNFLSIALQNTAPEIWITRRNAGCVAQAAAGERFPAWISFGQETA